MRPAKTKRSRSPRRPPPLPSLEEVLAQPIRLPTTAATWDGFHDWALSEGRPPYSHLTHIPGAIYIEVIPGGPMVHLPISAVTSLEGFCAWATSDAFPDDCRISYLGRE